jgi:vacuolar-type H+-ATPase subunit E/Vma4
MKINRHTFLWTENSFVSRSENDYLNAELEKELDTIEKEITSMYLTKQENKIGIKSLGNEIRKNKTLTSIFYYCDENITCFKMTENKRAFFHQLIEYLNKSTSERLRIYIIEKEFGLASNLVDSTFLTIDYANKQLNKMQVIFKPRFSNIEIEFIEICGFTNFNVWSDGNYSKIFKL